jgi:UDP-N-acetylglucosamine acyltransferase
MLSGVSGASQDIPPFMIVFERNITVGINIVGMRRAGIEAKQIAAVRRAYHILYRQNMTLPESLAQVEAEVGEHPAIKELLDFIKSAPRGVSVVRTRRHAEAA